MDAETRGQHTPMGMLVVELLVRPLFLPHGLHPCEPLWASGCSDAVMCVISEQRLSCYVPTIPSPLPWEQHVSDER